MKKLYQRALLVVLFSVLVAGFVAPVVADGGSTAPSETQDVTIDSALDASTGETTVIVRLSERPEQMMQSTSQDRQVSTLQAHADETQTAFERFANGNPHVEIEEQFWITNAIVVTVDLDEIELDQLGMVDNVERIHENKRVEATHATSVDADSESMMQAGVSTDTTDSYTWGLEMIGVPETWDTFDNRGDGVTVAVLDSGVDGDHPDIDVAEWRDFDDNPSAEPKDYGEHGTHVSGTVVGGDASGEYIGVAPDADLYHGAVLTDCDFSGCEGSFIQIVNGIQWAVDEDADVVSMSLGITSIIPEFIDPIQNARHSGTIPVASTGNIGEGFSGSPGNVYDSIAVGATTEAETVWDNSNGETITKDEWEREWMRGDLLADWPNEYTVPDVSAPGHNVKSAVPGGEYGEWWSGTSMAAPHVSGTIALMLSNSNGELTPDEVQTTLESTAVNLGEAETRQGAGRIDAYAATVAASPVIAQLSADQPTGVEVGIDSVMFDASESFSDEEIERYEWSFSGGQTAETDSPTITHTYSDIGEQTASVTVVDISGNTHTTSIDIDVVDTTPPVPKITPPDVVIADSPASFSAADSTDNDEIESYDWELGDGTEDTGEEITHTYTESGTKTVTLTATDRSDNNETTSTDITVQREPTVSVTSPEDDGYVSDSSVTFEYGLFETHSDGTAGVEYRLLESSSGASSIEWTDAPFEATEQGVSLSTTGVELDDGQYTVEFRLVDADGETLDLPSATDSTAFTVKTTPPAVSLDVESTAAEFDQIGPANPAQISASVDDEINDTATLRVENSDGVLVTLWDLSNATGNGITVTESWDASSAESGEYDIRLIAEDSIGNAAETSETVTVDTDMPSVAIDSIDGGLTDGEMIYANDSSTLAFTLDAEDGRESADGLYDVSLQVASETANYRLSPDLEANASDGTVHTAVLNATEIADAGSYTLSATVTDSANNTAVSDTTPFVYDDSSPQVSAVITDVDSDTDTATLRVRSNEELTADPSVTVTSPDGEVSPTLSQDGNRWTSEFDVSDGGQYELSATGVDLAGNSGSDTATTTVDSVSTTDRTTTVFSESSGMFIQFNTESEVENRTVAMTESDLAPEALDVDQSGVQFLTGELDAVLSAELESATIGIPTEADALPGSVGVEDDAVTIEYYNDNAGWESRDTTVETVEVTDSVRGEYWTTTVDSFSTYGVTVEDTEPPEVTAASAILSDDEESVILQADYVDDISGVNSSAVKLLIETDEYEIDVTDSDATSITSSTATHEMAYDGVDEYDLILQLEDEAGNNNGGDVYRESVSIGGDDSSGSSSGGGGPGGPSEASASLRVASFPSPSVTPDRVETGEEVTITATLETRGDGIVEEVVSVSANGERITGTFERMATDSSRVIELTHTFDDPGEYDLTIQSDSTDSMSVGTVLVTGESLTESDADSESEFEDESPDPTDDEVPGFGVVGALIALLGGSLVARYRSRP